MRAASGEENMEMLKEFFRDKSAARLLMIAAAVLLFVFRLAGIPTCGILGAVRCRTMWI